jgi:hypothetical protein
MSQVTLVQEEFVQEDEASVAALCYIAFPLLSIFKQEEIKEMKVILIQRLVRLLCMYHTGLQQCYFAPQPYTYIRDSLVTCY